MLAIPKIVWLLIAAIIIDVITGVTAAAMAGTVSSSASRVGMTKKSIVLLIVGFGYGIEHATNGAIPAGGTITSFYVVAEGISILENMGKLGIPIAPALRRSLAVLNQSQEVRDDNSDKQ